MGLRVDLVTPRFLPSIGGIEESVRQIAKGLMGRGHEVVVHTMLLGEQAAQETIEGIAVRRYKPVRNRGYYVSRFEPDLRGDVIHLHAYAHQTNDWVLKRHGGRVPIFYSTHHGARFPKRGVLANVYHAFYNRFRGLPSLRRATAVFVPTAYDASYFSDRGIASEKIHVVPSGADERLFAPISPQPPPGMERGYALFMGRLHPEKGILDLLAAHAQMPSPPPLVLVGRDEGGLAQISRAALEERSIRVISDAGDAERFGILAAASLLVLPSHYEGQGIVLIEAWAQGKPVIATRAGAVPFVVEDGVDGVLVPVKEPEALATALERVIRDPAFAARLGAAGKRKADSSYRWPKIVQTIEQHYLSTLEKARRA